MDIKQALASIVEGNSLSMDDMATVMNQVMTGNATEAQIGALLMGLRMKGETIDEIAGSAKAMRALAKSVSVNASNLVDICGTGGDGSNLFNVSTASSFVIAAAGGHVAKHGNRSVSSSSGSADLLEKAGVKLGISPEQVARCVEHVGVGFMFAPAHHSAMKYAVGPRRELALRTVFNALGPMTNPAGVKRQVLGVYDDGLCRALAEVLNRLGSEHVMVVHSAEGLDEISLAGETHVAELKNGVVTEYVIRPSDFGIAEQSLDGLQVKTAEESLALILDALGRKKGPMAAKAGDMIALNAGAAIYVSGVADSFNEGVAMAQDAIASGLAAEKIKELAAFTEFQVNQ